MRYEDLTQLKNWFSNYVRSYYSSDGEVLKGIAIKEEHTHNVCKNILYIGECLSLNGSRLSLAEAVALLHDIGRFEQFRKYRTFNDGTSVNHGSFGAEILVNEKVLHGLPQGEQELITQAVKFHNARSIPDISNPDAVFYLKLIRDADKVDIWRVFYEYYLYNEENRAKAVVHHLPDIPEYSGEMLEAFFKGHVCLYSALRTLNDFKLLLLSWVYDLNFGASFKLFSERGHLQRIVGTLPEIAETGKVKETLSGFISSKINSP